MTAQRELAEKISEELINLRFWRFLDDDERKTIIEAVEPLIAEATAALVEVADEAVRDHQINGQMLRVTAKRMSAELDRWRKP